MVLSAFAEVISLGAVIPFLGVLLAPETLFDHPGVPALARYLGVESARNLTWPLTQLFIGATVLAATIRLLLLWSSTRIGYAAGADLSMEVYRRTLYQPYRVHLNRNSSEVISGIVNKVNSAVFGVIMMTLTLAGTLILIVSILTALLVIDPRVAIVAAAAFGASYGLITWFTRRKLARNSRRIADEQTRIIQALQEGLGGIRDVLLDGTQPVYCDIYRRADQPLRRAQGAVTFIGQSPRYLMEALGIILVASLAYGLSLRTGGVGAAMPVLGALALGAQRLLPALQQSYQSWAVISGSRGPLADVLDLLDQPIPDEAHLPAPEPAPLRHAIRLDDVSFRYSDHGPWVLKGLNLTLPKGMHIGLVGATGSGKSTTMDLLMGLLEPTSGRVLADGQPIVGSLVRAWQQTIAHVPQSIFLADASIAANIALGVAPEAIDMARVRAAAQQAQIADFVEVHPEGYDAKVGERGIRLSGGQRQRIGIARALYKRANVLVFDEATSALDSATERSIMSTIDGLSRDLTVIMVAHRLSTVRRCDLIVELENGTVAAQGSWDELLESSESFRQMAHGPVWTTS
jgi:ATP-binding cassette subfamily B protein